MLIYTTRKFNVTTFVVITWISVVKQQCPYLASVIFVTSVWTIGSCCNLAANAQFNVALTMNVVITIAFADTYILIWTMTSFMSNYDAATILNIAAPRLFRNSITYFCNNNNPFNRKLFYVIYYGIRYLKKAKGHSSKFLTYPYFFCMQMQCWCQNMKI